jgi:2-keto-4-pentenoate hydratase
VTVPDDIRRGMAAQLRRLDAKLALGLPRVGWKIGINDPRMQRALGLSEPVVGALSGAGACESGSTYTVRPGAALFVEAEVAMRVAADGVILAVAPALELVDYTLPGDSLATLLEHSIFHEAPVFGTECPPHLRPPDGFPHLLVNDREVAGPDPLTAPTDLDALARLVARTLADHGAMLADGDRIISGAYTPPVAVASGDHIVADFGSLGRAEVRLVAQEDTA